MSVYIKGMEMPTSCHVCVAGYGGCCYVAPADADGICPDNGRADFCPLVPVPEHDRLIEYHAAVLAVYNGYKDFGLTWRNAEVMLGKLPTIIPAEEGEG